jgi:hypothetical protein
VPCTSGTMKHGSFGFVQDALLYKSQLCEGVCCTKTSVVKHISLKISYL